LAVITNDIYTHEDAEFLSGRKVLPLERIVGVQTGDCPHMAIRDETVSAHARVRGRRQAGEAADRLSQASPRAVQAGNKSGWAAFAGRSGAWRHQRVSPNKRWGKAPRFEVVAVLLAFLRWYPG